MISYVSITLLKSALACLPFGLGYPANPLLYKLAYTAFFATPFHVSLPPSHLVSRRALVFSRKFLPPNHLTISNHRYCLFLPISLSSLMSSGRRTCSSGYSRPRKPDGRLDTKLKNRGETETSADVDFSPAGGSGSPRQRVERGRRDSASNRHAWYTAGSRRTSPELLNAQQEIDVALAHVRMSTVTSPATEPVALGLAPRKRSYSEQDYRDARRGPGQAPTATALSPRSYVGQNKPSKPDLASTSDGGDGELAAAAGSTDRQVATGAGDEQAGSAPSPAPAESGMVSARANMLSTTSQATKTAPQKIPATFFECDMAILVELCSAMFSQLTLHNDKLPLTAQSLTRFHSRAPPAISVADYTRRIVRYTSAEKCCLLAAVIYVDRLSASYPAFSVSSLTIHRYLIAAITVASKGLCDSFCTNLHYARVGGIRPQELFLLETELLIRLLWNVVPAEHELNSYYRNLVQAHAGYTIA